MTAPPDRAPAAAGTLRRARWALTALPVLMAAALIATVAAGYVNVRGVLATAARGQAESFVAALRNRVAEGPPQGALEQVLEEQREAGLRCIALLLPAGLVQAGDCADPAELRRFLQSAPPGELIPAGDRLRLVQAPGQRPPRRLRPGLRDRPPGWMMRGGRGLMIEFEPRATRELAAGARRTLAVGGAAAAALIAAAVVFWRLSLAADRRHREAEHDRRLAALGRMSAVLAHEILNPLASMKGHAQLLAESLPAAEPASGSAGRPADRAKAERIVREIVRVEKLSRDLLSFVGAQRVERAAADPARVLADAAAAASDGATPPPIALDLARAPVTWSLDTDRIHQALVNLLRNGLQASEAGGDGESAAAGVEAAVAVEGGRLVFTVRDHGPGVPPEEAERIFEPFHTTRVRGTGLGLAVARQIAELHGGAVTTHNHPRGGAVFRVEIPRA